MDQLRSELMQERSARHDLEMDKSALERQVHTDTFLKDLCQLLVLDQKIENAQWKKYIRTNISITCVWHSSVTWIDLLLYLFCHHSIFDLSSLLVSQVKELKSRITDMGTPTRPSTGVTMLENKLQELEDRLRSEEK